MFARKGEGFYELDQKDWTGERRQSTFTPLTETVFSELHVYDGSKSQPPTEVDRKHVKATYSLK